MSHEPTSIIATVLIREDDDPHWSVSELSGPVMLIQDCGLNIGIAGTRRQLARMVKRMGEALAISVLQDALTEPKTEVTTHVE